MFPLRNGQKPSTPVCITIKKSAVRKHRIGRRERIEGVFVQFGTFRGGGLYQERKIKNPFDLKVENYFSSVTRFITVTAYAFRSVQKILKRNIEDRDGGLKSEEILKAKLAWDMAVQQMKFSRCFQDIQVAEEKRIEKSLGIGIGQINGLQLLYTDVARKISPCGIKDFRPFNVSGLLAVKRK